MCAKPGFTNCDSPSGRSVQHFHFARNAKNMDVKNVKMALVIIIRPSLQLCRLALGRSLFAAPKRPQKPATLGDDTSSTSSLTQKKKVRFNEQPVTISPKGFFERSRKDSTSSPARPCLIIREYEYSDLRRECAKPPPEADCRSVYEDCLAADYPGFLADLQVLEGDERSLERVHRSEFYETESGIAVFDRTSYANHCLTRWLDKQREEARAPRKLVFEDPALLPWPSHALRPPSGNLPDITRPMPPLSLPMYRPPRGSLFLCIWKSIEDEVQNAFVVVIIGLFIHICLFLFLLYDVLTRGLTPSDD